MISVAEAYYTLVRIVSLIVTLIMIPIFYFSMRNEDYRVSLMNEKSLLNEDAFKEIDFIGLQQ